MIFLRESRDTEVTSSMVQSVTLECKRAQHVISIKWTTCKSVCLAGGQCHLRQEHCFASSVSVLLKRKSWTVSNINEWLNVKYNYVMLSTFSTGWSQSTMCSLAGGENKSLISTLVTPAPLNFVLIHKNTHETFQTVTVNRFSPVTARTDCVACLNKTSGELGKLS